MKIASLITFAACTNDREEIAGTLDSRGDVVDDLVIINNWRSSHGFP